MLHRIHRLTTAQFDEIMKRGRVTHSPLFTVRACEFPGSGPSRIGAVAPAKIAKTAVSRNALRRKIYESVRSLLSELKPDLSIAVFTKGLLADVKTEQLQLNLREVFVKAGLLR